MYRTIPLKDIETAETIAVKLATLNLEPTVEYKTRFEKVRGLRSLFGKVKRTSTDIEVWDWTFANNLEAYRQIEKKLLSIAPCWTKTPLFDGNGIKLSAKSENVSLAVNIEFQQDMVVPIMSQILNCEIEKIMRKHEAHTSISYACPKKRSDPHP